MTPGYEYFEVEADVGVLGCGADAAEAFVQTGLGVFALIVDPASVREQERREVRAHGEGLGDLLVNWINECLYIHDVEGFVARRIELVAFETSPRGGGEPLRLHAFLHGEEVDPGRHRLGTVVKAATLHQVTVAPIEGGWQARLIVDV